MTRHPRRSQKYIKRATRPRLIIYTLLLSFLFSILFLHRQPKQTPFESTYQSGPSTRIISSQLNHLSYTSKNFTLNKSPVRLVSGSIHYFRAPPTRWRSILLAARSAGLNAVSTYVPWNLHEPRRGRFRWSGMLDLRLFLELAQQLGLFVLLRPGPYICSEWDFGGLPPYLLADPSMRVRSTYPPYIKAVETYFDQVYQQIRPYIGRPIVAIQLENEYGAFGEDKAYMHAIQQAWITRGVGRRQVLFFTSDNGGPAVLSKGSPFDSAHVLKTVNFDWQPDVKISMLRSIQPKAPAMVAEFWVGWFDHWGEPHHTRDGEEVVRDVRQILFSLDASINLYMFFGGTNFGFMSGANIGENMTYQADVTSYDYDAFLSEQAEIRSDKYELLRNLLKEFWTMLGDQSRLEAMEAEIPEAPFLSTYTGKVPLSESVPLFDVLDIITDTRVYSKQLLSMEEVGGDYGFVLYRHNLTEASNVRTLQVSGVHDFAYIIVDGAVLTTIDRNAQFIDGHLKSIYIPANSKHLDIIVENRGRVNYGPYIHDRKGILGSMTIDGSPVEDFEISTMSFRTDHPLLRDVDGKDVLAEVRQVLSGRVDHPPLGVRRSPPTIFRGIMTINSGPRRSAFGGDLPGTRVKVYGRGVLWVNGFNCGRFDTGVLGPQRSLFVPGALLQEGINEFVVLHMQMRLVHEAKIQLVT